jgi:predicted O-methyltransferase YrrM
MTTITTQRVRELLDRLYADEQVKDPPAIQTHISHNRRLEDYSHEELNELFAEAYLPVDRQVGDFLYVLARAAKAKCVVEFGTSFGISTIFLASAVQDNGGGVVIGTEAVPAKAAVARKNLAEAGLAELLDLREGDARETLADVRGPIDLLLLDAWKDLNLPILKLLEPKLAVGALIIVDDTDHSPQIHVPYLEYVRTSGKYHTAAVPIGDGMEISTWLGA